MAWHLSGRIKYVNLFDNMKASCNKFKDALQFCRDNEMYIRKQILIEKFRDNGKMSFWKEVKKIKGVQNQYISYVDGTCDPSKIASIFDEKFAMVFKDPSNNNTMSNSDNSHDGTIESPFINLNDVNAAIDAINLEVGWDKVHAYHLKLSGPIFRNFLAKFFDKCLYQKHLPKDILGSLIKPIIKNSALGKSDSGNYRPIMNFSNFLQIFEVILKNFLQCHIRLN